MADKKNTSKKDIGNESDKDIQSDKDNVQSDKDNVQSDKTNIQSDNVADVDEYKDKYILAFSQLQRLQADFDNYRKRVQKEKLEIGNQTKGQMILPILEVIDNLERAIKSANKCEDAAALKKGVELTLKQLKDTLAKEGLSEIVCVGEKFNPEKHEALLTTKSDEHEDNIIFEELQKGYIFNEKVIRPTKVKVVKND
ncbi:MAG: nucleotide exchange factor GrpE [DPANN group archaeon]|nr:nucleotide exchange factor GrpE [DPANN group archaeon]